ncbi:Substrate binding domain of ABC-type glycine betaine transport system [anaerobic digester metagenome]
MVRALVATRLRRRDGGGRDVPFSNLQHRNGVDTMELQVGRIDLSFHHVAAAVVLVGLERAGVHCQLHTAPHEEMFTMYARGKVDMVVGAWLPASHGKYLIGMTDQTVRFSVLYTPYCLWGVPEYVPAGQVASVADILKPEVSAQCNKVIQGINEGAGISRFSRNVIREYGLDKAGFTFRSGTIADCTDAFIRAHEKGEWVVVPLWQPQYLFHSYKIRALQEPRGLLGGMDQACIILRKDALAKLTPRAVTFLKGIRLGNAAVTDMDYQYVVEGMPLDRIARDYLDRVCI